MTTEIKTFIIDYMKTENKRTTERSSKGRVTNMEIKTTGSAGTYESCDAMITVRPGNGITIDLNSDVIDQFGDAIKEVILKTLEEMRVRNAVVEVVDKGAFDCVIRSRLQAAVCRAGETRFDWEGEDRK